MGSEGSSDRCPVEQVADAPVVEYCLVSERVAAQAWAQPQNLAIDGGCQKLTFAELERNANQLAHLLRSLGVGPDTSVGVCLQRSASFIVGALAVLKAGGAYVCLDPSYPSDRLGFMLEDSQPAVVLTNSGSADHLPAGKWSVLA